MADRTITAHIPEDLGQQLDTLAAALRRDQAWVIEEALRAYIATTTRFLEAVQEGIRAADAGDVLDHDVVMAELDAVLRQHGNRRE